MTLSFDQSAPRGLDAMLIVYSLLDDHPVSTEQNLYHPRNPCNLR